MKIEWKTLLAYSLRKSMCFVAFSLFLDEFFLEYTEKFCFMLRLPKNLMLIKTKTFLMKNF